MTYITGGKDLLTLVFNTYEGSIYILNELFDIIW